MRQFHFRLEKLLELKKYEEREWELKLAHITGACMTLESKIRTIEDEIHRGNRCAGTGVLNLTGLQAGEFYILRLKTEKKEIEKELAEKNKERAAVSKEFLERSRDRKVLDKLKEKKGKEFYKEQIKEDFKHLDEINDGALSRKKIRE